jgi:hypothetical protein
MSRADVPDIPRPPTEEYTICTAVAPDAVFTVRTYDTGPAYAPVRAQIRLARGEDPQVSEPPAVRVADRVKSRGPRCLQAPLAGGGSWKILA